MQLKQLEIFVNVIKLSSFSKAAEVVYLTQPTVSAHISALEEQVGTKLIVRSTKEVYPTPAGKLFYEYAVELLKLYERALLEVQRVGMEIHGTLSIVASTVPSQYILPHVLSSLSSKYPQVFCEVLQTDSSQVVSHILSNRADLGFTGSVVNNTNCTFIPFAEDRLVIITPNTPTYQALNGNITANHIKTLPFIARELGSGTRKQSEQFLNKIGIHYNALHLIAQMQSTESILQAVKSGLGISIVSRVAAEAYGRMGAILIFDYADESLNRYFYLVHHKNRPLSPAAEAFIQELSLLYPNIAK